MSNVDTVAMALGAWRERGGPLFAGLAAALAEAAHRGTLPASGELPAERALAEALGVSRGTVVSAYRELRDRGLAETRHGSGTVIRAGLPPGASWPALSDLLGAVGSSPQMIDLSFGVPPLADVADLLEVNGRSLASKVDWHGYAPLGLNALRQEVAALLTRRGAATSAEEVLITGGAQEAIALAVGLLASDGRRIAVESPGYAGALDAIARVKGVAVPVARDAAGIRADDLKQQLERRPRPRSVRHSGRQPADRHRDRERAPRAPRGARSAPRLHDRRGHRARRAALRRRPGGAAVDAHAGARPDGGLA